MLCTIRGREIRYRESILSDHTKYWLGFSFVPEIGPKRLAQLYQEFGNLREAWAASDARLRQSGLSKQPLSNFLRVRDTIDLDAEMEKVKKVGAWLLTLKDDDYPDQLKEIPDAPTVLYIRGTLTPADKLALSIVGTRKPTAYGRSVTYKLAQRLVEQGITIISGMAQGIDSMAHLGALDNGGRTIAILGSGIDVIYPSENQKLAERIVKNGALISEFHIGTPPEARNFPRRNRIISGMALGVLVAEAPDKSGVMITVEAALNQGREVFAIPANIFNPMGRGANRLIQEGAKLVMRVSDVLNELDIAYTNIHTRTTTQRIIPETETEELLLKHLEVDPMHVDVLIRLTGLPSETVLGTLVILELKGLAQNVGHMQYSRTTM